MDLVVFDPVELIAVTRMLRTIAAENGVFTEEERDLVEGVARMHGVALDASALEPIEATELAKIIVDPHKRKRALQLAVVTSLVEGPPTGKTEEALDSLAGALDLGGRDLKVLHEVADGQIALARFDMVRRLSGPLFRGQAVTSILKTLVTSAIGGEDRAMAARYRALGERKPGTFGRALFDHYVEHEFAFPGEKKGIPERGIFHDAGHVLSGYGVDPAGEIQQAAFQAGFIRNDGFSFFLFGILQFHIGIRLTPIAKSEVGYFDVKRVLRAAQRGASCKVDLSDGWSVWDVADRPLAEVREEYGILAA